MPNVANAFCSIDDLAIACGGTMALVELADTTGTGNINDAGVQSIVTGWILDGAAEIRSKAEVKHDPETLDALDAPSQRRINDANAVLAARVAHEKGAGGREMPERLKERAARADKYLDELATGYARLGRVTGGKVAALNQPVGVVDYDPLATAQGQRGGTGLSIASLKLGFR